MTPNTGGPAFPAQVKFFDEPTTGMNLRDYFAAMAMLGILTAPRLQIKAGHGEVAFFAYSVADAMLKEREQK